MREPTRGRWSAHPGQISVHYDIFTDESEGMIAQNVRWNDAQVLAASKDLLAALKSILNAVQCLGHAEGGLDGLGDLYRAADAAEIVKNKATGNTE